MNPDNTNAVEMLKNGESINGEKEPLFKRGL